MSQSALSPDHPIDVICGSLPAKLFPDKLKDGFSRSISFTAGNGSFMTPCEFECRAGRSSSKNWKRTIRYAGKPIGDFLQCVVNQNGKKEVSFVTSTPPLLRSTVADTASLTLSVSTCSSAGRGPIVTSAIPDKVVSTSTSSVVSSPASPDKRVPIPASLKSVSFPASPDNPVTFPASLKAVSSSTSPVNVITIPVSPVKVVSSPTNPDKVVPSPASPDEVLSSSASPDKVVIPVNVVSSMASPDKGVAVLYHMRILYHTRMVHTIIMRIRVRYNHTRMVRKIVPSEYYYYYYYYY